MSKKKQKILNPNNPLITNDLKIIVNENTNTDEFERKNGIIIHKEYTAERAKVTKLYTSATNRKKIADNSPIAKNIILWIMYQIEYSQDYLYFDKFEFMSENKVKSIKTVNAALTELIKNKIIAKSNIKDIYFFNPVYLYRGSRQKNYPDNVEVYKPTKKAKQ